MAERRHTVWTSPLDASRVARGAPSPAEIRFDGEGIWWSERRPAEGGRVALVCRDGAGEVRDMLPDGASARSRVHEYGGGAWDVRGRLVAFVDDADDGKVKVFTRRSTGVPSPGVLSPRPPSGAGPFAERYADLCIDVLGERVFAVRERHHSGDRVTNDVVALPAAGTAVDDPSAMTVICRGADFYGQLALSGDARRLALIRWMLPDMPWDATELVVVDLTTGSESLVAGGPGESCVEPTWAPDGTLVFSSDRTGWWNLYRWDPNRPDRPAEAIAPVHAEIGGPMWVFGNRSVGWLDADTLVAASSHGGTDHLVRITGDGSPPETLDTPFTHIPQVVTGPEGSVLVVAGGPRQAAEVWQVRLFAGAVTTTRLRPGSPEVLAPEWISTPDTVEVTVADGARTHAIVYPPTNPEATDAGPPPLLVLSHGGPTSAARVQLDPGVQYWTSRGFCVADVNYRGSTGYGRPYREALNGGWGIVDVEDCAAVARHLAASGAVDPRRLGIRGQSAGGFTTLAALCFTDTFTAGVSSYGIADLEILARDTHKFESRYLDRLVGPWPEARSTYDERSPIRHLDGLDCPVGILQGAQDAVVPPAQAESIVEALRKRGLAYAYLVFADEGHGFRRSDNIVRALEAQLWFFARAFGLELSEDIEPVPGDGLAD